MVASAEASAARLERNRAERAAYLAGLAQRRELNARQISSLEAVAAAARRRSATLVAPPTSIPQAQPATDDEPSPVTAVGQALTVTASGYSLQGQTASGVPVGWGVIAVDPSVIPLGTAMTIPGYGGGVAADIGTGVHGTEIDLWFPTREQALAWGRRTVTITLH
jgi:3D (Asp-Asp-Asp) domain-containing protein